MPFHEVHIKRWQIVGAFVLLVLIGVVGDIRSDQRVDDAERRIRENTVRTEDLAATNRRQDRIRAALLSGLVAADRKACLRIEALKTQNRLEAQRSFAQLARNLRLLDIPASPEIVEVAARELAHDLRLNAAQSCERRRE